MDKRYDLSLVDVGTALDAPIALSEGKILLEETERLFNIVCAANSNGTIYSGTVSGPPRKTDRQVLWQVNMQIRPGSSGSPVFDLQGNLVAVVKGRYRGADTVGFLIPFASVMKFLGDDLK
jgi:serine protease Do